MTDYWIKLYIEVLDDPKMGRLPDRLWRRSVEVFLVAGRIGGDDKSGLLPPVEDMAWILRITPDDLEKDFSQLAEITGIVTRREDGRWVVTNFSKRQGPSSDAERKRYQRDRERKEQYAGSHDHVTNPVTKRETETETESDTESELLESEGAGGEGDPNDGEQVGANAALSDAFVNASAIQPHQNEKWDAALQELRRAGVQPEELTMAVKLMAEDGLTYTGPWSVAGKAIWVHAQRAQGKPVGARASPGRKNGGGKLPKPDPITEALRRYSHEDG